MAKFSLEKQHLWGPLRWDLLMRNFENSNGFPNSVFTQSVEVPVLEPFRINFHFGMAKFVAKITKVNGGQNWSIQSVLLFERMRFISARNESIYIREVPLEIGRRSGSAAIAVDDEPKDSIQIQGEDEEVEVERGRRARNELGKKGCQMRKSEQLGSPAHCREREEKCGGTSSGYEVMYEVVDPHAAFGTCAKPHSLSADFRRDFEQSFSERVVPLQLSRLGAQPGSIRCLAFAVNAEWAALNVITAAPPVSRLHNLCRKTPNDAPHAVK
ncbi:hypothetical protein R3P38DRAFT_2815208 [Favolaschia claudopus]|uniref:Vitellogenin n=1 Tax=Favolaschia claudopus TaxID=2862362 RepID=A0AAV9Z259_9AGAR